MRGASLWCDVRRALCRWQGCAPRLNIVWWANDVRSEGEELGLQDTGVWDGGIQVLVLEGGHLGPSTQERAPGFEAPTCLHDHDGVGAARPPC